MRIRQIALVAGDLPRTLDDLQTVLGLGSPFPDPGVGVFGLANGVFPVDEQFLEVDSPKQPDISAGRAQSEATSLSAGSRDRSPRRRSRDRVAGCVHDPRAGAERVDLRSRAVLASSSRC